MSCAEVLIPVMFFLCTYREDEPDTDPDEEEYEGYTGNAGPTVE
jgi:hypothetical protein